MLRGIGRSLFRLDPKLPTLGVPHIPAAKTLKPPSITALVKEACRARLANLMIGEIKLPTLMPPPIH